MLLRSAGSLQGEQLRLMVHWPSTKYNDDYKAIKPLVQHLPKINISNNASFFDHFNWHMKIPFLEKIYAEQIQNTMKFIFC